MPPRRSQRSKQPSAQALVSSPPQRVRRQSLVVDGSSTSATQQPSLLHEALAVQPVSRAATLSHVQSQQPPAAPATDQPAVLTSPVMEQLVSRVTDEVTKRLQPLLSNLSSMAQQAQSTPSSLSQAPALSLPVEQSTSLESSGPNIPQVQGHAAVQDTVEVPAVHDGVQSVLASLSEWIAREKLHIDHILHLLDDFLIVFPSHDLCKQQLDLFLMLCQYLGIPMAPEKQLALHQPFHSQVLNWTLSLWRLGCPLIS